MGYLSDDVALASPDANRIAAARVKGVLRLGGEV